VTLNRGGPLWPPFTEDRQSEPERFRSRETTESPSGTGAVLVASTSTTLAELMARLGRGCFTIVLMGWAVDVFPATS
jgi:hypothetical protein